MVSLKFLISPSYCLNFSNSSWIDSATTGNGLPFWTFQNLSLFNKSYVLDATEEDVVGLDDAVVFPISIRFSFKSKQSCIIAWYVHVWCKGVAKSKLRSRRMRSGLWKLKAPLCPIDSFVNSVFLVSLRFSRIFLSSRLRFFI